MAKEEPSKRRQRARAEAERLADKIDTLPALRPLNMETVALVLGYSVEKCRDLLALPDSHPDKPPFYQDPPKKGAPWWCKAGPLREFVDQRDKLPPRETTTAAADADAEVYVLVGEQLTKINMAWLRIATAKSPP